ncbi:polysaccharide deacetylase family protein [Rudanella paleaurantiibacter]|uniref:Polysaccharide deacetylase family protein n=1 Tax=Rudanella paleaurantiibacter TaxID=2614655 RepID=A0A7J5U2L7_9BACT|nr:glycoside hydrolase family 9 protein [Rudanella paleaurantiibacter]KAB7731936.1 polysaccharide deacetylase family protein [Rudanella paleaurantiibacter]
MTTRILLFILAIGLFAFVQSSDEPGVIRINLLGYRPASVKVAVWASLTDKPIGRFELMDAQTDRVVWGQQAGRAFGAYGPFAQTHRLDFSAVRKPGRYYLRTDDGARSPEFRIGEDVYDGTADFCLRYMRQQRSGFNPFLKDSCHTHDGYTLYGPMPDSTHIDASGGWHDASDYLQYVTTSANATYHLLAAARDFPGAFGDAHAANGLEGANGYPDVLDEARWGLDWLLKMHPTDDWLFNQLGDDRDHAGMRIPKEDKLYGKGFERPLYFASGTPQGMFKYKNRATGVASTAGKVSSALALGYQLLRDRQPDYAGRLWQRSQSAYRLGLQKPGNSQTAPGTAPYFYEEDNYVDDMELAAVEQWNASKATGAKAAEWQKHALNFARQEPVTPWILNDTARHYQWYPFVNIGHAELAKRLPGRERKTVTGFYKQGIDIIWQRARQNAFYRGVPFIWCSNNYTTSFATQCFWYRQLTGDTQYAALEQANFDWLFGCNPWGTSFVYGLPGNADTPADPHSAFTHLKQYPIDGGLVDGPVRGSIYGRLIGITLYQPDEYAPFQSRVAVYHDDYGDYSTNEPTMDGTASLVYLLAAKQAENRALPPAKAKPASTRKAAKPTVSPTRKRVGDKSTYFKGAKIRGDTSARRIALVFTGDEYADGGEHIARTLQKHNVRASFFLTGRFLRNPAFAALARRLLREGHYLGPHSDAHLLYCDWKNRDSLLVTRSQFAADLRANEAALAAVGWPPRVPRLFMPPFEWYNDTIAAWSRAEGWQLINYTPGTLSHADYTTPDARNYRSSDVILQSIRDYERRQRSGLNGFILLMHVGTAPARSDKLYAHLDALLTQWKEKGYDLVTVDAL